MKNHSILSSVAHVKRWLEANQHHEGYVTFKKPGDATSGAKTFHLSGRNASMQVPSAVWAKCYVKPASNQLDKLYEWDHKAEAEAVRQKKLAYLESRK